MSTQYNGWTNRETWLVKLWIDNEQGEQDYWQEIAAETYEQAKSSDCWTKEEAARFALSERLKDNYDEAKNDLLESAKLSASVWSDLLGTALCSVNWDEIAESMITDAKQTVETQP